MPVVETLVNVAGSSPSAKASAIAFDGITFEHGNWLLPRDRFIGGSQAEAQYADDPFKDPNYDGYGGEVPGPIEDLVTLPGVGRKTANVVRSVALDLPGFPVDTHVGRLVKRLDITQETDPVKVERVVDAMVPAAERGRLSLRVILHGRRVCSARSPACGASSATTGAPSAGTKAALAA